MLMQLIEGIGEMVRLAARRTLASQRPPSASSHSCAIRNGSMNYISESTLSGVHVPQSTPPKAEHR